jgi:hypothetical protein
MHPTPGLITKLKKTNLPDEKDWKNGIVNKIL